METCIANSHRIEYLEDAHGITWWKCIECDEMYQVYSEHHGC